MYYDKENNALKLSIIALIVMYLSPIFGAIEMNAPEIIIYSGFISLLLSFGNILAIVSGMKGEPIRIVGTGFLNSFKSVERHFSMKNSSLISVGFIFFFSLVLFGLLSVGIFSIVDLILKIISGIMNLGVAIISNKEFSDESKYSEDWSKEPKIKKFKIKKVKPEKHIKLKKDKNTSKKNKKQNKYSKKFHDALNEL